MRIRRSRILLGKMLLLLIIVAVSGVAVLGCVGASARPMGWSGTVMADDTLFFGSMKGELVTINLADDSSHSSEPLKTKSAGSFGCVPTSTAVAIYGTPAVTEDLVYVGGYNGKVYAFDYTSLATRWIYPREGSLKPIVGGLMVSQGKLYFGCSDGKVCALDAATGDKEWEFETGDKIWSTPAIDGGNLYIGSFDKKLYAIDAATGEKKWEFESGGAIAVTPVINNHTVYIGSLDRSLYALSVPNGKLLWQFPVNDEVEHKPGNWFWTKPVIYNNIIYAANLDGKVYILNTKSGEEAASCVDLKRRIISSPALVDSLIVIALDDGQLWTIDTDNNEKGLLIDLGEEIYAPLCAGEGVVYIHTQKGSLYEVDTRGAKRKLYPIE